MDMKFRIFLLIICVVVLIVSTETYQNSLKRVLGEHLPDTKKMVDKVEKFKEDLDVKKVKKIKKKLTSSSYKDTIRFSTGEIQYIDMILDGQRDGVTEEFNKDGSLRMNWIYDNGKLNGDSKQFFSDGSYAIWTYKNDEVQKGKTYYNTNALKEEYSYKDNFKDGYSYRYYKSGEVKTKWLYNNDLVIEWTGFYKNGKVKLNFTFEENTLHGTTNELYKNGNLKLEWNYNNGHLQGISKDCS